MNARIVGFQEELTPEERARFEAAAATRNLTPGFLLKSILFPNPPPFIGTPPRTNKKRKTHPLP